MNSRRVWIVCSPSDREAAVRLAAVLDARGHEAAIASGEAEATRDSRPGLGAGDALVFLVSPASLASPDCTSDLDRAVALDLLVIPVVLRVVAGNPRRAALEDREWIVLADDEPDLRKLTEALEIDPRSRDQHESVATRTREWVAAGCDRSLLLRGVDLLNAETWLETSAAHRDAPSGDEARYIAASRRATVMRRRAQLGAILTAVLVAAALTVVALVQRSAASRAQRGALSSGLDAQAIGDVGGDPALAVALAVEAHRAHAGGEADTALLTALDRLGLNIGRLTGHTNAVTSVAFGGPAPTLVSGSLDGTVRIWDFATRSELGAPLRGGTGAVNAVAVSRDGELIASAGDDGTIRLWSAARHAQVGAPLRGHVRQVESVAFSPDGTTLVSGGVDSTVRLWSVASGREIGLPLRGSGGVVAAVAFSPDSRSIVSAGGDGSVRLWSVATHRQIAGPLLGNKGIVRAVAFSPDGQTIASGGADGTVRLWNLATHSQLGAPIHPGALSQPANPGDTFQVGAVAFSPDGLTLASADDTGALRLWDVATHRAVGPPLPGGSDRGVAFSPDGTTLAAPGVDSTLGLWNIARSDSAAAPTLFLPRLPQSEIPTAAINDEAFTADTKIRASAGADGLLRLWNVSDNSPLGAPLADHAGDLETVAFRPGATILAAAGDDGAVRLWSTATRQPLGAPLLGHDGVIWSVAFSPDGKTLAAGGEDGTIRLWNVATLRQQGTPMNAGTNAVDSLVFSPDGKTIAAGADDGNLRLWNAATHTELGAPLQGHVGPIERVVFNPRGTLLASAGSDKTVRLWEVATRRQTGSALIGHTGSVKILAFSSDGKTLATASDDGTVRLWSVATHQPIGAPLTNPLSGSIVGLAFRPGDRALVSADRVDNEAEWNPILWQGSENARLARACAAARRNLSSSEWREFLPDSAYHKTCAGL
jgi:WD40 repeat protein